MSKNPWVAAILNLVLPGVGYLYLQKRVLFGWLILGSVIAMIVWVLTDEVVSNALSNFQNIWGNIGTALFGIGFAVDAYQQAKDE